MNLRDLDYIVSIEELGTMARAAAHCHVSQSTLSIQLRKLEEYLGVALFERNARRLVPTEAGRDILAVARGIVQDSRRLKDLAARYRDPQALPFRLGLFPTLAPYLLPRAMPMVSAAFPRLVPRLIEEKSPVLVERLASGAIDAALLALPVEGPHLETAHLFDDPFLLACPARHPLARRKTVALDDLEGESLLLLDDGHCLRNQALDVCHIARAREKAEFRATSLETLRQMVAAGVGLTLMPRLAATPMPNIVYVPFARPHVPLRRIGMVWRASSTQKKLIGDFVALLRKTKLR